MDTTLENFNLSCRFTFTPGQKRAGELIDVLGDGWCLLRSLALTTNLSAENQFFELASFLVSANGGVPINAKDVYMLFLAYYKKEIWFDDRLVYLYCNKYKVRVRIFNQDGCLSYDVEKSKNVIDLHFENNHYKLYSDCMGVLVSNSWVTEDSVDIIMLIKGFNLSIQDTRSRIQNELPSVISEYILADVLDFNRTKLKEYYNEDLDIIYLTPSRILIMCSESNKNHLFLVGDGDRFSVASCRFTLKPELLKQDRLSYFRVDPQRGNLSCSEDYLSDPFYDFKSAFLGLINFIFEDLISEEVLGLFDQITPTRYDNIGGLCKALGICLALHYGHQGDTRPAYYGFTNCQKYHLVYEKDIIKYVKKKTMLSWTEQR
ncbi:hypothetical protein [Maize yellow stripe virus]|nr:hypothetical protein [Maize yellow stripe virus]